MIDAARPGLKRYCEGVRGDHCGLDDPDCRLVSGTDFDNFVTKSGTKFNAICVAGIHFPARFFFKSVQLGMLCAVLSYI